jgi:class 3 adenylate cyclase
MSLNESQARSVLRAINAGLDIAEENWTKEGKKLTKIASDNLTFESARADSIIPGHPLVEEGKPIVDKFISIMIDMRDSTNKLALSPVNGMTGFQRIYYETSALLPAVYVVSGFSGGVVTEYLGDGALVLHKFIDIEQARDVALSALNYVEDMRLLLNKTLYHRYELPEIDIGVGVSTGPALVTLVGYQANLQAKAIGECVWESSKLCCGRNRVYFSQEIYNIWPSSKDGRLSFRRHSRDKLRGVQGYYLR